MKHKQKLIVLGVGLVSVFPIVAALFFYYVAPPEGRMNHGDLLQPAPLSAKPLTLLSGGEFRFEQMKGKWLLLQIDSGNCEARCREKLYAMRQIRLAQGKDMVRLERVWLLSDDSRPAPDLMVEYEGTLVVRAAGSEALAAFSAPADRAAHLYVVDPQGNLMMRFPEKPDPTRMIKDLQRLLRPSRIGAG
jgi:cytochrome oxidase Cu insertion factor (SCO1/SenC/PrrC family)